MAKPGPKKGARYKSLAEREALGRVRKSERPEPKPFESVKPKLKRLPTKRDSRKHAKDYCGGLNESDERALSAGYRFSKELADYAVGWIAEYLCFSEGIWFGKRFELADWQRKQVVHPAFGWVHKYTEPPFDGLIARRIRKVYVEVAKKNGKSPLAAAIGLYMWAGDGESGAHCAACALDHNQAAIVHDHAVRMVLASPRIKERAKINRQTHRMLLTDTESVFSTLSEEQKGAQRSEGRNFHFMSYDEVHVAQRRLLYEATEYAFESRPEPMWIGLTTAGEENQGLWYDLREHGEAVSSGDVDDPEFLSCIHRADKDDDPWSEDTWRKANPSIGVTIQLSRIKAKAETARQTPSETANFRRYRTNVAPGARHPWLNADDWEHCLEGYCEDDLRGKMCFAGLDLSRKMDMSAFVLQFPDEEVPGVYRQLFWYWMPRMTVELRAHLAPYFVWGDRGDLTITDSDRIAFSLIEQRIIWALGMFDLRGMAYDPLFATRTAQDLQRDHKLPCVEFPQTILHYAEPTDAYESLLRTGNMRQNGNAVAKWQAGHVEVYEGKAAGGNPARKPTKRPGGDHRTVDGIQAAVMGLRLAMNYRDNKVILGNPVSVRKHGSAPPASRTTGATKPTRQEWEAREGLCDICHEAVDYEGQREGSRLCISKVTVEDVETVGHTGCLAGLVNG